MSVGDALLRPAVGNFPDADPIGYEGGINLYAYCANNPINAADPSGLDGTYLQQVAQFLLGELKGAGNFLVATSNASSPIYVFIPQSIRDKLDNPFSASSSDEGDGVQFGQALAFVGTLFVGGPEAGESKLARAGEDLYVDTY